jgi:LacI family transcriptional regulator
MRDIAAEAGVSVTTASRALAGKGRIAPSTVDRVRAVAERHRFRPSELARSLTSGRSNSLGLLVPDVTNPFFAELMAGAERAAKRHGRTLLLAAAADGEAAHADLRLLGAHGVDGLIVVGNPFGTTGALRAAAGARPLVVVDRAESVTGVSTVVTDHRAGAALAVRHLVALGHTRIAHLAGPPGLDVTDLRILGYTAAMTAAGLAPRVVTAGFGAEAGAAALRPLLAGPIPPTAVTTANDLVAIGAMNLVLAAGGRVPGDLSVVGYDDVAPAALVHPGLTTVAQDIAALGGEAVAELDRLLAGGDGVRTRTLGCRLVERGTTGRAL